MNAEDREFMSKKLEELVDRHGLGRVAIYLLGWLQCKLSITFDFELWKGKGK